MIILRFCYCIIMGGGGGELQKYCKGIDTGTSKILASQNNQYRSKVGSTVHMQPQLYYHIRRNLIFLDCSATKRSKPNTRGVGSWKNRQLGKFKLSSNLRKIICNLKEKCMNGFIVYLLHLNDFKKTIEKNDFHKKIQFCDFMHS